MISNVLIAKWQASLREVMFTMMMVNDEDDVELLVSTQE